MLALTPLVCRDTAADPSSAALLLSSATACSENAACSRQALFSASTSAARSVCSHSLPAARMCCRERLMSWLAILRMKAARAAGWP